MSQRDGSSHQQSQQHQRHNNNTTNLTLNMNFNLQQSTIQVQPMAASESVSEPVGHHHHTHAPHLSQQQRMFQSPRSSQSPMPSGQPHQQMTPVQISPHHPAFKSPEIHSHHGLKSSSPKTYKLAQIRGGHSNKADSISNMQGAMSPPNLTGSKVKKIKVNKLSAEQLNQIRANQQQSKVGSASVVAGTHPNQQLLGHEQMRTGSVGRHSTYAQMALNMQQQQAMEQHGIQMSPQNPSQYLQQIPVHHVNVSHVQQPLSDGAASVQMQTQKYSGSNMSARQSKNFNSQGGAASNQSPAHAHQIESDSKLGRKGERPTVAQILEIGVSQTGQSWMDTERQVPQQLSRLTLNSVPMYNATVTSNFESLGRNSIQAPPEQKAQQSQKGLKIQMDEGRIQPKIQATSPSQNQQPLNLPQFRRMRKSKNRKHDSEDQSGNPSMNLGSSQISSGITRVTDQTLNSTTAAASHSRSDAAKMHYSEGGRVHSIGHQTHQTDRSSAGYAATHPTTFIPLLLDVNSRSNSQSTNVVSQQQLMSRLQQQILPQATMIRHPQMGELPVIQMTSAQLQMVQQAAANRQNLQSDGQLSTETQNAFHSMAQMLAAQGLPSHSQLAFAIQVSDVPQPTMQVPPMPISQSHQPKIHNHIQSPMSSYTHNNHPNGHYQQQMSHQQVQLPSLRHQNNHATSMQHQQQQQNQTLSPHHGGYQMMSQAPIKKMRLNSRGKSVPRSTLQIEGDTNSVLLDRIQNDSQRNHPASTTSHMTQQNPMSRQQQLQLQQQQQQFQDFAHHSGYSVNNRIVGNTFFQSQGQHLQPISGSQTEQNQFEYQSSGQPPQPPLLAPLPQKGHRKSMHFVQSPDSAANTRDVSQQSRRHPAIQHHYAKLSHNASNAQQSRNLATQSDRGSGRSNKQGTSQGNSQPQNVYVAYKGPLSDLIMTQQSNLNLPNRQSGSGMRLGKGRTKSSSITVNSNSQAGEPAESSSHNQEVNESIPYIFENQKINQAINQEEFQKVRQHLEMSQGAVAATSPQIIIGELIDLDQQQQQLQQPVPQPDFVPQESKSPTKKKGKGRKGGLNNQNKNMLSKSTVDNGRFGQRQLSQQPGHQQVSQATTGTQLHAANQEQRLPQSKDKKKKFINQHTAQVQSVNQSLVQSHPESSYLEQQQQLLYQEEQYVQLQQQQQQTAQHSITPQNLKPNIQLKVQKKVAESQSVSQTQVNVEGVQGSNEPSLGQHGIFVKTLTPACTKYYKSKNNSRMTPYKYKNGISNRLLVAKETFSAKRAKLPVMMLNIDGVLGHFDEQKNYISRERSLQMLQSLSHNYKIVGFSHESKGIIQRFGRNLSEHKHPFAFDAVYQIQRKPVQNQNRVNLTQIILDFSGDDEEDLDLFVSSQLVLVTYDKMNLKQKFESMDLREVFDYDKEYLKGSKAPLIIRVPHARCRPMSSLTFETLFQLLTCLLVTSKLSNLETTSFFTYNDRTKALSIPIPTSDKGIVSQLLPDKMKLMEKTIVASKSLRFMMSEAPHGMNLHKGFKLLTEVYRGNNKPDWIEFNYRIFKPLLPIRMRLQKITQYSLKDAQPPTGKKLMVRCETEEATRKYQVFCKKNEVTRKQIRKYRARYWAVNQIDDCNLDEENQDIVGDLLDDAIVATTLTDIVPPDEINAAQDDTLIKDAFNGIVVSPLGGIDEDEKLLVAAEVKPVAEGSTEQQLEQLPESTTLPQETPTDTVAPTSAAKLEEEKDGLERGVGCDSTSSESVSDIDIDHYDEEANPVKFKVIEIKHIVENEGGPGLKKQQAIKAVEQNKPVKIECRKIPKSKCQYLLDFFSKKQNSMMFTTNQQQHLQGAQALQIENQIAELVQKLNEQDKNGKKEVYNYDF